MRSSPRRTPQPRGKSSSASPEYSPPPFVAVPPNELSSLWAELEDGPGSQISYELQVRVEPEVSSATDRIEPEQSPLMTALDFIQEQRCDNEYVQRDLPGGDMRAADGDIEMPDLPPTTPVNEPRETDAQPQRSLSPALTLGTSSTTPAKDMTLEANTTATFDETELDFFLKKQSEPDSEFQPTPQELANTQIWGHMDPREVWPQKRSEEWYAEKRREIDARGGRKANYGTILTSQGRKERAEKGWHIHQNSEAVPANIMAKTARHMEELFGAKGIDDLLPCVRNGQLAMSEKAFDDGGRRKRKGTVKVYPVAS